MRSATFRNVALGILALVLAYSFGAQCVRAGLGENVTSFAWDNAGVMVVTPDGETYYRLTNGGPANGYAPTLCHVGNFWGGATPVQHETLGQVKSRYAH